MSLYLEARKKAEYLKDLLERDKAKKPLKELKKWNNFYGIYTCPNKKCGLVICPIEERIDYDGTEFCYRCGQRFDWDF